MEIPTSYGPETAAPQDTDYRGEHVGRGEDYDRDLACGNFDTYMTAREHAILGREVSRMFPGGVPRYLDFACGTGRITERLEPLAREAHGVDVAASMVERARRKCPRTHFRIGDPTRDEVDIPPVDLATAFRFFGNAQDGLRREALAALHRLIRPGGILILNNHKNRWSLHALLRACRGHRPDGDLSYRRLRRMLRDAGFRVVRTYGIGAWLVRHRWNRPAIMRSRLVRWIDAGMGVWPLRFLAPDLVVIARRLEGREEARSKRSVRPGDPACPAPLPN